MKDNLATMQWKCTPSVYANVASFSPQNLSSTPWLQKLRSSSSVCLTPDGDQEPNDKDGKFDPDDNPDDNDKNPNDKLDKKRKKQQTGRLIHRPKLTAGQPTRNRVSPMTKKNAIDEIRALRKEFFMKKNARKDGMSLLDLPAEVVQKI